MKVNDSSRSLMNLYQGQQVIETVQHRQMKEVSRYVLILHMHNVYSV